MTDVLERAGAFFAAEDEPTRLRGVHLLRDEAPDDRAAHRLLVETLADPGRYVPHAARAALQTVGAPAVPALIDALDDAREVVRVGAAWALAQPQGEDADRVLGALGRAAGDTADLVRHAAAGAAGRCGGTLDARVSLLRTLLGDRSPRVRAEAATSCGLASDLAEATRDALLDALDDGLPAVRLAAAGALRAASPSPAGIERAREALAEEAGENVRLALASLVEDWKNRA